MSKNLPETNNSSEDIDLGQLFKLIGNAFERLFSFLGGLIGKLLLGFVWLVFFVKKHIIKLVIAAILGFGVATLQKSLSPPQYGTAITVRQNYNTGENLYDMVNYFNSLMALQDSTALKRVLGLSDSQMTDIIGFDIEPLTDENSKLRKYNNYIRGLDSSLAVTIDYDTYLENVQEQDFTHQTITIKSKRSVDLTGALNRMVESMNSMEFFVKEQEKDLKQLINREEAIKQSLKESEVLQQTYKRVLEQTEEKEKGGGQTTITIEGSDRVRSTKEFELFKNDLVLRRELVLIERDKENKEEIVEVISNEFNSGLIDDSIELLGFKIGRTLFYTFAFMFLTLLFLSGLEFLRFLEKYKDKV